MPGRCCALVSAGCACSRALALLDMNHCNLKTSLPLRINRRNLEGFGSVIPQNPSAPRLKCIRGWAGLGPVLSFCSVDPNNVVCAGLNPLPLSWEP